MIELVSGLSVVGLATIVCALSEVPPSVESSVIQYGALGLCGFMVWFLCGYIKRKEEIHAEERKETAKYLSRVATLLGERKCLAGDRETLNPESQ